MPRATRELGRLAAAAEAEAIGIEQSPARKRQGPGLSVRYAVLAHFIQNPTLFGSACAQQAYRGFVGGERCGDQEESPYGSRRGRSHLVMQVSSAQQSCMLAGRLQVAEARDPIAIYKQGV